MFFCKRTAYMEVLIMRKFTLLLLLVALLVGGVVSGQDAITLTIAL